jgi:ribonuclease E
LPPVVEFDKSGLPEDARTRGIDEAREPRAGERGKRKPRRDRSEIARQAEPTARDRMMPAGERVSEAQPNAEVIDVAASTEALFPERTEAPDRAVNDPRNPRSVSFEDVGPSEAMQQPAPEPAEAAELAEPAEASGDLAPAPLPPRVFETTTVELVPPAPREQPVGRAYNDPREVRRREREAQLRREGEVIRPENAG